MTRYLVTGGASFVFEYSVFIALVYGLDFSAGIGQAVSYTAALFVNYLLLKRWAFTKHIRDSRQAGTLLKYLLLVVINMPLTTLLVVIVENAGVEAFVAKLFVVALAACWNFIIYDRIVFRTTRDDSGR